MIKKCDHTGCTKAGTCRAPKSRDLSEYWLFCKEHAADYNKNWNYYANMSPEDIEADWERHTFGTPLKDKKQANDDNADYVKFINDFITGRSAFDRAASAKSALPSKVVSALRVFDLPISASWREVQTQYRKLAKRHHPDIAGGTTAAEFINISAKYEILKQHFGK